MNFYNGHINLIVVCLNFFLLWKRFKDTVNVSQAKIKMGKSCSPLSMQVSNRKKKKSHQQKTNRLEKVKGNNFRVTSYNIPSPFFCCALFLIKNHPEKLLQTNAKIYIYIHTHLFTEYSKQEITLDCWTGRQNEQRSSCFCSVSSFYTYIYSNQC